MTHNIIIVVLLSIWFIASIIFMVIRKKKGKCIGCSGDCSQCSGCPNNKKK